MASASRKNITLALIGRVGNGKSACGNSILGKVVFPTSDNSKSCTHEVGVELKTRIDCEVKVVDTPGFMDRDAVQDRENSVIRIPELMRICPEGVHAFCLVLKYGAVDIDKDKEAVKKIKDIFGENVLRDYGIIIMTHGDNFDLNNEREEEGVVPFQLWCKKQTDLLKTLMQECSNRVVLFYNRGGPYDNKKEEAVKQLLCFKLHEKGAYTIKTFADNFKEKENEILKQDPPKLCGCIRNYLDEMIAATSQLIHRGSANEEDVTSLRSSNKILLNYTFVLTEDNDVLIRKVQLIHRKLITINLNEPIIEQLTPILKILVDLKNPPMSSKSKAVIAILVITAGIVALAGLSRQTRGSIKTP